MHTLGKPPYKKPKAASKKTSGSSAEVSPREVVAELEKHILVDGFKLIFDLEKSKGSRFVDAATGREWIDLYGFYASQPVGFNHPYFNKPSVKKDLLAAAKIKIANADVYSVQMATFVKTFSRVVGLSPLERYFFIEGGAAAVENALKTAMDWKVRKNLAAGRGERGTEIIHFTHAFHGRSGYTMSLTNTDLKKTQYFAKFPWPRISSPSLDFSLSETERLKEVIAKEKITEAQICKVIHEKGNDIAAIIIEPIQGEGGDNHFRGEFLKMLRRICDERDILLIFDEIQCGMGITGKNWCCEHFGVLPDLLCFGKKAQVCGVMAGPRIDKVENNCFRLPSRINSTWGANFTDYVRSTHYLKIYENENLAENSRVKGELFIGELQKLAKRHPKTISAVRGRGLMLAFDLTDEKIRDEFWRGAYELGLLVVRSGDHSIRLRPVLDVKDDIIEESIRIMDGECRKLESK